MVAGGNRRWAAALRRLDEVFLRRVMKVWRTAIAKLPESPGEDAITKALVAELANDRKARQQFYCDYQFVPIEWGPAGEVVEDRYIDMAAIFGNDRRTYIAYECKKLNVPHSDGIRRSQAAGYVDDDGMMRFVTEKYAKNLPIGCMIGYIMDGDIGFAYARIKAAMTSRQSALGLKGKPSDLPPVGEAHRFVTKHSCNDRWMEIRHALLPFTIGGTTAADLSKF